MSKCHFYRRAGGGFLCLTQGRLEEFVGDAIATSTNCRLEGIHRKNWWGFVGKKSADAALHEKVGPSLLQECHSKATELPFGSVLTTAAGPKMGVGYVLHTAVPSHAGGRDPRPMSAQQAGDFAYHEEAMQYLTRSYGEVLKAAAELETESLACPAIGCGCRGYPVEDAARIGLHALAEDRAVPYIEVRILDWLTYSAWQQECIRLGLKACTEGDVKEALWEGEPLASWHERRVAERRRISCPVL